MLRGYDSAHAHHVVVAESMRLVGAYEPAAQDVAAGVREQITVVERRVRAHRRRAVRRTTAMVRLEPDRNLERSLLVPWAVG